MKRIIAKEEFCMGCGLCEVYCTVQHSKSKDIIKAYNRENPRPLSRVKLEVHKPVSFAIQCRHCEDAPCVTRNDSGLCWWGSDRISWWWHKPLRTSTFQSFPPIFPWWAYYAQGRDARTGGHCRISCLCYNQTLHKLSLKAFTRLSSMGKSNRIERTDSSESVPAEIAPAEVTTAEVLAEVERRRAERRVVDRSSNRVAIVADRFVFWFSKHWLAAFSVFAFLYVGLPVLAPVLMYLDAQWPAAIIYTVYRPLCHQLPQRSFFLFGPQWTYTAAELMEKTGIY